MVSKIYKMPSIFDDEFTDTSRIKKIRGFCHLLLLYVNTSFARHSALFIFLCCSRSFSGAKKYKEKALSIVLAFFS